MGKSFTVTLEAKLRCFSDGRGERSDCTDLCTFLVLVLHMICRFLNYVNVFFLSITTFLQIESPARSREQIYEHKTVEQRLKETL